MKRWKYAALGSAVGLGILLLSNLFGGVSAESVVKEQRTVQAELQFDNQPAIGQVDPSAETKSLFQAHPEYAQQALLWAFGRTVVKSELDYPGDDGHAPYCGDINPYLTIVACKKAPGFADHPDLNVKYADCSKCWSTAAGAYQFLKSTWDDTYTLYSRYWYTKNPVTGAPVGKFDPLNQDLAFTLLLIDTGGYQRLMGGYSILGGRIVYDKKKFLDLLDHLHPIWLSLPPRERRRTGQVEVDIQGTQDAEKLWRFFQAALEEEQSLFVPARRASRPIEDKFPPALKAPAVLGDRLEGFRVTDVMGYSVMRGRDHNGFDFGTPTGTHVKAFTAGSVVYCAQQEGYGTYAVLEAPVTFPGRYWLLHHLSSCKPGQYFKGQTFGATGGGKDNCPKCTGPHLHLEMRVSDRGTWRSTPYAKGWFSAFIRGGIPGIDFR